MLEKKISQYLLLEKLGEGGMGVVYLAEDTVLGRRVAIKTLKSSDSLESNQYKIRFLREARLASTLNHPNIVSIYDYGETAEGLPYLVMEYVKGKNLSDLLRQEKLPVSECVKIIKQIAKALSFAHEHGIIHRDLKPSNIFVNERGDVKVLDFGLAKLLDADSYNSRSHSSATSDMFTETRHGVFMGTPSYSSPEQLTGNSVDRRSDIFSLGAVFYECLSGQPAFAGKNFAEICAQVIKDDPLPPSQVNLSVAPEYDEVALKALSKKAENRYQTVDDLLEDLETVMFDSPTARLPVNFKTVVPEKKSTVFSNIQVTNYFRKSVFLAIGFLLLTVAAVYLVASGTLRTILPKRAVVQTSAEFNQGVEAIRNGNFYKAKKLLETAIQKSDDFPLAHARLAEALLELGYEDEATKEILRVTELMPTFSNLSELDKLNLQAIAATVRRNYAGAIENYRNIVEKTPEENKKFAYFDLGRAFDANDETDKAIENFSEAAKRDERFAAAHLKLGMLYGRKQETAKANEAFQKAEKIYNEQSDYDSVAEVHFRRGQLFNLQDKLPEANEQMKRANEMANATKNTSLQVRSLLQLSSIAYSLNDPNSRKLADEAIEIARNEQLDNLASIGLIDIGNIFFTRGKLTEAEAKFKLALQRAQTNEWKSVEARANLSLGSLYLQQTKSAEAIRHIEPALDFYNRSNFRKETLQAQLVLGYANDQLGNYDAAIKAFSEQLRIAEELGDESLKFYAHTALGIVSIHRERFIEALEHYDKSLDIAKASGFELMSGYSLLNRGQILWQMGRYDESREALEAAAKIAGDAESGDKQLLAWTHLVKAESSLSENNYQSALVESDNAIDRSGMQTGEIFVRATFTKGLANVRSGRKQPGKELCQKAVEAAEKTGMAHLILKSKLALAETFLASDEPQKAAEISLELEKNFSDTSSLFSQWRSIMLASEANKKFNDNLKSEELAQSADQILARIESESGAEFYKFFISRPDVQVYIKP